MIPGGSFAFDILFPLHLLDHLKSGEFFSFLLLQCIIDRIHQIAVHRDRDILQRIRPLLGFLDIRRKAVRRILHLSQLDRQVLHRTERLPGYIYGFLRRPERVCQVVLPVVVLDMRDLRSHDTPGLYPNGFLDRNGKCKLFYLADPLLDIRTLETRICSGKCNINLFLYVLCLIDQFH